MTARDVELRALDKGLDGASLWGLELDTRYRVLAGTVEPIAEHHPYGDAPDRRLQLLLFPCSVIRARMTRQDADGNKVIERFEVGQLVDVLDRLDGPVMHGPFFDRRGPEWGSEVSLRGESSAPDGRSHTFRVRLERDERTLELYATFDDVQVLTPESEDVPITLFRA